MPRTEYRPDVLDPDSPIGRLHRQRTLPCRGQADTFDIDEQPGESTEDRITRLRIAVGICRSCPARTLCAEALLALPPHHQRGLWAGQVLGAGRHIARAVLAEAPPVEMAAGA
ncbi:hypothetical protein PSU4_17110 [Pseudonocardia sulfidoxydans NBRC 16205]|uniref:4Fe-4S Wbl-type domain-containing protein n=1 Tax=Pseudonocardia sulfidoxydans NBRC 16205 TaxID=1223511 RepID=A0A511DDZ2_9PSEU|nr:hypothetical protein [Pseudonocardia sulfidoxydans]GEL22757.1 hypothetical protein PSU4_17110 [Pseudonocardia sulfidoxydans NBRC 16205]